jgi:hypothetical protein
LLSDSTLFFSSSPVRMATLFGLGPALFLPLLSEWRPYSDSAPLFFFLSCPNGDPIRTRPCSFSSSPVRMTPSFGLGPALFFLSCPNDDPIRTRPCSFLPLLSEWHLHSDSAPRFPSSPVRMTPSFGLTPALFFLSCPNGDPIRIRPCSFLPPLSEWALRFCKGEIDCSTANFSCDSLKSYKHKQAALRESPFRQPVFLTNKICRFFLYRSLQF